MGVIHLPRFFDAEKIDPLGALSPPTHETRKVSKEALTQVGGRPRGLVLGWEIE